MIFPVCLGPEASLMTESRDDASGSTTAAFSRAIGCGQISITRRVRSCQAEPKPLLINITYFFPSPLNLVAYPWRRHLVTKDKLLACEPNGGELDIV